jgi:hypothetical protein
MCFSDSMFIPEPWRLLRPPQLELLLEEDIRDKKSAVRSPRQERYEGKKAL